jgi:hypothetical protein
MSPRRTVLVVLACALAHAPLVRAEDDPGPRRPAKPGEGFRFSNPDDPATPKTPEPTPGRGAQPEPAANEPAQALIRRLSTWPGQDGIKAAESLLLMGPEGVDPVRRAVAKGDSAVKPGAAWVLGKVGTTADVGTILTAAADRPNGSRLETFFEAAYELDPTACKRWMFGFLSLDRPVFRARARSSRWALTPEDRPKLDGLLRAPGKQHGVRMAGLELLSRTRAPDAADRLVVALGDPHPTSRVARDHGGLSTRRPSARPLNVLVREGDARERAYAMLSFRRALPPHRVNAFEPATIRARDARAAAPDSSAVAPAPSRRVRRPRLSGPPSAACSTTTS